MFAKLSDIEILTELRNRNESAMEWLVRKHTKHLLNAGLGLGFAAFECEELVQAVWEVFFESLDKFKEKSSIRTYLFGILYNKASEHRRSKRKIELKESIEDVLEKHFDEHGHWLIQDSPLEPDMIFHHSQISKFIGICLEFLTTSQRAAFVLKEVDDLSTTDICEQLQISVSHLGVLLFRARNQLRECLETKVR